MTVTFLSPTDGPSAAERIRASTRVAVDTEFHAEHRYLPELYLVQLGLDDGSVLLVDPLVPGLLASIGEALRARPWVVHGGEHDLRILTQAFGGPPREPVFDTQVAAGLLSPTWPASLATLCEDALGVAVDKSETLSDWSRRPLAPPQLAYAAADVRHLFPLADALAARLDATGRLELARLACADAVTAAIEPPTPDRLLRELTASTALEPRRLAVLRALAVWRDERGRASNQPPRAVASDGVLNDLARRVPTSVHELGNGRRFPKHVARMARELLDVMEAALAAAPASWPTAVRRGTPDARRAAFVNLWAQVVGDAERWSAGLVLPRDVVEPLVLGPLPSRTAIAAHLGWRDALVGDGIAGIFDGSTALSVRSSEVVITGRSSGPAPV